MNDLREIIKTKCKEIGLTQRELAFKCGLSEACISRYFLGNRNLKIMALIKVLILLGMSVDESLEMCPNYSFDFISKVLKKQNLTPEQKQILAKYLTETV